MLNRLLVLALAASLGALTTVACTDNSGNGNYNPGLKMIGGGGADGGSDAADEAGNDAPAAETGGEDAAGDTATTADGGDGGDEDAASGDGSVD